MPNSNPTLHPKETKAAQDGVADGAVIIEATTDTEVAGAMEEDKST